MRQTIFALGLLGAISCAWAEVSPTQTVANPTVANATLANPTPVTSVTSPAIPSQPSLRQNMPNTTVVATPAAIVLVQQKHKQEMEQHSKRLVLLEQANQQALAKNQELQIKNDNLTVQAQVLQSERSAQMFLYGAVTFGAGTLTGLIIYSLLYTRRRRSW